MRRDCHEKNTFMFTSALFILSNSGGSFLWAKLTSWDTIKVYLHLISVTCMQKLYDKKYFVTIKIKT